MPCAGLTAGVFPVPPAFGTLPPPPEPPSAPVFTHVPPEPPPPPPADVIDEKVDGEPEVPLAEEDAPPAPPAPTVMG